MSELSRGDPVGELIDSLDQVGSTTANRLQADRLETVGDVAGATPEELMALDGVGKRRAERIHAAAEDKCSADPLVDTREVVLEATLGEKLTLTMADREGYACEWAVVDTEEPTTWQAPTGDTWQTRRIRISQKMNGAEHYSECDLVVGADEIRLEDPPVKRRSAQPNAPSWRVESVGAVGRVERSTHAQLQGRQQQADTKPEGDDTWRRYQSRGETA